MNDGGDPSAAGEQAQVRLLSSPVRQGIVDTQAALGDEADLASLADRLGRPTDGPQHHRRAGALGIPQQKLAYAVGSGARMPWVVMPCSIEQGTNHCSMPPRLRHL